MPDSNCDQMMQLAEKMDTLAEGFDDMVTAGAGVYLAGMKIREMPENERLNHVMNSLVLLARIAGCEIDMSETDVTVD